MRIQPNIVSCNTHANGEHVITMSDGTKFKTKLNKNVFITDVKEKYVVCHYELEDKLGGGIWIRGKFDNLHTLEIDSDIKSKMFEHFPIKEGETVLELGAYAGFGTMKLSKLVGPTGRVYSVEGDTENYGRCVENMNFNNIKNITFINECVWSEKNTGTFWKRPYGVKALVPEWGGSTETKSVNSLDNIISENNIKNVDFMSMEINLAEYEALKGAPKLLSQEKLRIVATGWYKINGVPSAVLMKDLLEKYDFKVFIGPHDKLYAIKGYF